MTGDAMGCVTWWDPVTGADSDSVGLQLGRPAAGLVAVAARCRFGRPSVVVNAPILALRRRSGEIERGVPFPTTFWLVCPYLVQEVSRLESQGWIHRLAQRVRQDPGLSGELERSHREAAHLRMRLLPGAKMEGVEERSTGILERLRTAGVGGILAPQGIKCLHAHLADHLGRGSNPVGRLVAGLLAERGVSLAGDPACRAEAKPPPPAVASHRSCSSPTGALRPRRPLVE